MAQRQEAYREHVEAAAREGLKQSPWDELQAQVAFGDEAFIRNLALQAHGNAHEQSSLRQLKRRPEFAAVVGVVEQMKKEAWDQFSNRRGDWGREMVLFLARHHCGTTLKQLGERAGGMDSWAVSKAIHRFQVRLTEDPHLTEILAIAHSELSKVPI